MLTSAKLALIGLVPNVLPVGVLFGVMPLLGISLKPSTVIIASMALGIPAMILALYFTGRIMFPALFVAEFLLLLNTGPLNAAVVNSVGAHIRATAVAVNLFTIHLLGDALSPTLIGYISDRSSLQSGFTSAVVAIGLSSVVLFVGMKYAPPVALDAGPGGVAR